MLKSMMMLTAMFVLTVAPAAMAAEEVVEAAAAAPAAAVDEHAVHEAAAVTAAETHGSQSSNNSAAGWMAIATGIGLGLAALGGALGQSRVAAAAVEGLARNPNAADKLQTPMILGLAFIESLVLFVWVVMFLIQGKF